MVDNLENYIGVVGRGRGNRGVIITTLVIILDFICFYSGV